jgi:hypothetical protein
LWPDDWLETAERLPWPSDAPSGDEMDELFEAMFAADAAAVAAGRGDGYE